jgi:hypothetical protein
VLYLKVKEMRFIKGNYVEEVKVTDIVVYLMVKVTHSIKAYQG